MTGLGGALFMVFVASTGVAGIGAWFYVGLRLAGERSDSLSHEVRYEAIWGIVLSLPLALGVLTVVAEPGIHPLVIALGVFAVVAFYAIPVLAILGRQLPRFVRWLPAAIAISAVPLILVYFLVTGWDWLSVVIVIIFGAGLGVGYAADCMVAVRFARVVAERDAAEWQESLGLPAHSSNPAGAVQSS